jgi:TRAP-type C4-dicarboxylate transport system substrate-binding protein
LAAQKPVKVPDDVKGMKWASTGQRGKLISSLGGAAIPVPSPLVYQALQTGQAEAAVLGYTGAKIFRALEITNFYNSVSMGGLSRIEFMSKEAFNKMIPGDQKIFMDLIPEILERGAQSAQANSDAGKAEILKLGQTIYDPTEEEMALWDQAKMAAEEGWLQDMDKAGIGDVARNLLNRMRELAAQSRAKGL